MRLIDLQDWNGQIRTSKPNEVVYMNLYHQPSPSGSQEVSTLIGTPLQIAIFAAEIIAKLRDKGYISGGQIR